MKNNEYFLQIPNEIMNTKHELHYELLNFDTNIALKIFVAVLAKSTMIYKANKQSGMQTFSTKGFLSDNSFIPRKHLNNEKLKEIINSFNSKFFDFLLFDNKQIQFELSAEYIKTLNSGFTNINLMDLKKHKDLKTTKLAILTTIYPSTTKNPTPYFSLNYLFKYLNVNKDLPRTAKIHQIKKAFSKLENIEYFEYKHPVSKTADVLPEHYKFHYKTAVTEVKKAPKIKEEVEKNIDEIFNADDLNLDDDNEKTDLKTIYLNAIQNKEYDYEEIPF